MLSILPRACDSGYDPRVADNGDIAVRRLGVEDRQLARDTFALMVEVFGETPAPLSDDYLQSLLARPEFWAFAALRGDSVVGGLTAHTLMMTAFQGAEVFVYDIAVARDHQRQGIGRRLIAALRHEARSVGISTLFVPADDEDSEALQFYSALGGTPSKVTFFEFGSK
jgi:aminoglycoside 3-N-acetyltransferase I